MLSPELIANEVIPAMENYLFPDGFTGKRFLVGLSMGGFNALMMWLKFPDLWDKAAFIAPLIPVCDPFLAHSKLISCINNDPYKKNSFYTLLSESLVKSEFKNSKNWDLHNPNAIGESLLNHNLAPALLTIGDDDEYGFFARNLDFAQLSQEKKAPLEWRPTHYEHGVFDVAPLAEFLLN
jgi:pimeloyl-ACP methyl ester carboxylesterase